MNTGQSKKKIRVMWLSINASLFDVEKTSGGWTSSLERALREYHEKDIDLAVVFEKKKSDSGKRLNRERLFLKAVKENTVYYQISNRNDTSHKGIKRPDAFAKWEYIKPEILSAIEDFRPDVIQCFGSEWPYGMITEFIDIPVIIHMQGFLEIYNMSANMIPDTSLKAIIRKNIPENIISIIGRRRDNELENRVMFINRYFMGRTEWDRNIVMHYSRDPKYYEVPEAIRPEIFEAAAGWAEHHVNREKAKLLTISQERLLKGNDIILQTARIMKELLGLDFEWRIAGDKNFFMRRAKSVGIDPESVNIKLLGFIPARQILSELTEADMFVHPSIIDNSPNAICEAQIIGCPVVASNVGGVPDLIEDGVTGILYPYNEPHTLAFKIEKLMQSPQLLKTISDNETKTACLRHDPETIANAVYRVYLDVIDDYINKQ